MDNQRLSDVDRTRLIASLFVGVLQEVFVETAQSMPLMEGAMETVLGLRKAGYSVGVVTDSFHVAAEVVRRRVFADFCVANILHFRKGAATGDVTISPAMEDRDGCPLHPSCKANLVKHLAQTAGLVPANTLAIGDGLNDICMLSEAGVSVAFRPKSRLVEEAAIHVLHGSLLEILDLPGVRSEAQQPKEEA